MVEVKSLPRREKVNRSDRGTKSISIAQLMITPKSFLFETSAQGVATITLNRPERLNALTFEVYRELTDTFAALKDEADVRAVVITGAGRAFCSGGDVHDIIGELFSRNMEGFARIYQNDLRAHPEHLRSAQARHRHLNGTTAVAGACIALAPTFVLPASRLRSPFFL